MSKVLRYVAPPGAARVFTETDFQNVEIFDQIGFEVQAGRAIEVSDAAADWLTANDSFQPGEVDIPQVEPLEVAAPQLGTTRTVTAEEPMVVTFEDGTSLVWETSGATVEVPSAYADEVLSYPNFSSGGGDTESVAESVSAPAEESPPIDDSTITSPTPEDVSETPEGTTDGDASTPTATRGTR